MQLVTTAGLLLVVLPAMALDAGSEALPWDSALTTLRASVTGPIAFTAAVVGMIIAGAILVFGNDLNRFGQSIIYLVLVIGMIILGVNGLDTIFDTGASVSAVSMLNLSLLVLLGVAVALSVMQYAIICGVRRWQRRGTSVQETTQ